MENVDFTQISLESFQDFLKTKNSGRPMTKQAEKSIAASGRESLLLCLLENGYYSFIRYLIPIGSLDNIKKWLLRLFEKNYDLTNFGEGKGKAYFKTPEITGFINEITKALFNRKEIYIFCRRNTKFAVYKPLVFSEAPVEIVDFEASFDKDLTTKCLELFFSRGSSNGISNFLSFFPNKSPKRRNFSAVSDINLLKRRDDKLTMLFISKFSLSLDGQLYLLKYCSKTAIVAYNNTYSWDSTAKTVFNRNKHKFFKK